MEKDEIDLKRGQILLSIFIGLLVILGSAYIRGHIVYPSGPLSPTTTAVETVNNATRVLNASIQDTLEPEEVAELTRLSEKLSLIGPQLGASTEYSATLDNINAELKQEKVQRIVLTPLFDRLSNIIQVGPSGFFWPGTRDRWIELTFWIVAGTLVFLISENKKWCLMPYEEGKRNFEKYTSWYFANLVRGPFIAFVILLALTSISFDAFGISIDVMSAPIWILIPFAAILGYYAREADKQLDIIAKKILPDAWNKAHPEEQKLVIEPHDQNIELKANQTKEFTVQPNLPVQWFIKGKGEIHGGKYTSPDDILEQGEVILLAQDIDNLRNIACVKINLIPDNKSSNGSTASWQTAELVETDQAPSSVELSPPGLGSGAGDLRGETRGEEFQTSESGAEGDVNA
jgi:hypothetical protein